MKIYSETSLRDFEFWSGAKNRAKYLTGEELDRIEMEFEIEHPDGMDETEINDLFWFEENYIAQILGYDDFETLMNERKDE